MSPGFELEDNLFHQGTQYIAGLDEVGRGCLAGPVAAGLVVFSPEIDRTLLVDINDSKKLSSSKREFLSDLIYKHALVAEVAIAESDEIDQIGIVGATKLAMKRCVENSLITPQHLLVDAIKLDERKKKQENAPRQRRPLSPIKWRGGKYKRKKKTRKKKRRKKRRKKQRGGFSREKVHKIIDNMFGSY